MTKEYWVAAALTNDALVAELLLRLKQSESSRPRPATPTTMALVGWGNRRSRTKPPATTAAAVSGCGKEQQQQQQQPRGSPTTPLSWTGTGNGAAASTSDGYDESSRPSDLSSAGRSNKAAFANDGASTSSYNRSKKRKSFVELKEEEGYLLKERVHLNKELASMRVTWNQQVATSENLKRIKVDLHPRPEKAMETAKEQQEPQDPKKPISSIDKSASEIKTTRKEFVLPDLNMPPSDEDLAAMS